MTGQTLAVIKCYHFFNENEYGYFFLFFIPAKGLEPKNKERACIDTRRRPTQVEKEPTQAQEKVNGLYFLKVSPTYVLGVAL